MADSLTFNIMRRVNADPAGIQSFDVKRDYAQGGVITPIMRRVNTDPAGTINYDTKRDYIVGGLPFGIQRRVNADPAGTTNYDTKRDYIVGGLPFNIKRRINVDPTGALIFDVFRIKNKTLYEFNTTVWAILRTVQPYGVPWLNDEVTSSAWAWRLQLADGTTWGFTSHDQDVVLNGITYEALTGFLPTAVDTSNNLSVDNMEVTGFLDSDRINSEDIQTGRFDFAEIVIFMFNWRNLKDPLFVVRRGRLGQVVHGEYGYQVEVRGLLEAYQQKAGQVFQKVCRATLGDSKCKISLASYTTSGSVTLINSDGSFTTNLAQASGFFDYGLITFTSGKNAGHAYEVKLYQQGGGTVTTFLPTLWAVNIGDSFTISAGCDRNFSTCKAKFNNGINFRGEPFIPGNDYQASYPGRGTANTVQEGQDASR